MSIKLWRFSYSKITGIPQANNLLKLRISVIPNINKLQITTAPTLFIDRVVYRFIFNTINIIQNE